MDESEGERGKGGGASSRILTWWTELSLFMVAMNQIIFRTPETHCTILVALSMHILPCHSANATLTKVRAGYLPMRWLESTRCVSRDLSQSSVFGVSACVKDKKN